MSAPPPLKTVYILGAGFSIPAGGPSQSGLMAEMLSPRQACAAQDELCRFLAEDLHVDPAQVALEDILTPIDRCLHDGVSLRGRTQDQLLRLRGQIEYLIARSIRDTFAEPGHDASYVSAFARHLVDLASQRAALAAEGDADAAKNWDPVAVVTLNWDLLLDVALDREIKSREGGELPGPYEPIGVIDYCCYVSSLYDDDGRFRPALWALGAKGYNVKVLKMHGSLNWLQCTNCQRLFASFEGEMALLNQDQPGDCRLCRNHGHPSPYRGTLLMPTFLKNLSNFQLKLIWQNAAVELMEARRLVFLGYSLPHADFEFRQLLSRTVRRDAEIEVVLNPASPRLDRERARYQQFFSRHQLHFPETDVRGYVLSL
jgi:hypothetical protein